MSAPRRVRCGGAEVVVHYGTGVLAEYRAAAAAPVRMDRSHLEAVEVTGPDRHALLNRVTTNDVGRLPAGRTQETLLLGEGGAILAPARLYRFDDRVLLVADPAAGDRAWAELVARKRGANVRLKRLAGEVALLTVRGAGAARALGGLAPAVAALAPQGVAAAAVAGAQCFVARTTRYGAEEVELLCRTRDRAALWAALAAPVPGVAGAGVRDLLRLEAAVPRVHPDLDGGVTPLEAGLERLVAWDKESSFTGRRALEAERARGPLRRLALLAGRGRTLPRPGDAVCARERPVGHCASAAWSPLAGAGLALALVDAPHGDPGRALLVRGPRGVLEVTVVPPPRPAA